MPAKLQRAKNGTFYIHYTEGRRTKRFSTRTGDRRQAELALGRWLLRESAPETPIPERRKERQAVRCHEAWSAYHRGHVEPNVAAPDTLRFAWKNLDQHFGARRISDIDQGVVDTYRCRRATGQIGQRAGDATVRRELAALRAYLNWCADSKRRLIAPSQLPAFDLPPEGEPRDRWLRTEEIERLLAAAAGMRHSRLTRAERFLWLALQTAARKTALLELTWDRVDFETNVIHLNVPGRKVTKKRRADVPISKALRPVLERAYAERINDLVLDNSADVWAAVQIVAERAGFRSSGRCRPRRGGRPKRTGISPNVLRHTAATHMARGGVPLWKISKILGSSLAMVEKVYARHSVSDLREAIEVVSSGWSIGDAEAGASRQVHPKMPGSSPSGAFGR